MLFRSLLLLFFALGTSMSSAQQGTDTQSIADTALANRYLQEARGLIPDAKYDLALEKLGLAAQILERTTGIESRAYAHVLYDMGRAHYGKGEHETTLAIYQKVLDIRLRIAAPEYPDLAMSYYGLGNVYLKKGDYEQARSNYQVVLGIQLKFLGPEHPDVAKSYAGLANVCNIKGENDRAFEYYYTALNIYLKKYGSEHPDLAVFYNNLGAISFGKGNYEEAGGYYQKALDLRVKTRGEKHPEIALFCTNLGNVSFLKGDYDRAFQYYHRSLGILISNFGPEHEDVASNYTGLGSICAEKGEYTQAQDYFQKGLAIKIKAYGAEHPEVSGDFNNLGIVSLRNEEYDRALEYFQKATDIRLKTFGAQHPDIASNYLNSGEACRLKGESDKALHYYEKVFDMEPVLGANHVHIASACNNSAIVHKDKGDFAKAIELTKKSLLIREITLGKETPDLALCCSNIAEYYKFLRNFKEGEPYIPQALQALRYKGISYLPQVNSIPQLIQSLGLKGLFYCAWHKHSGDLRHLRTARQALAEAIAAIDYQHQCLVNPGSKYTLAKIATSIYEPAIAVSQTLYRLTDSSQYWQEAYKYAEKSKSFVLYGAMREANALQFAGLPDSLLQKEYQLRVDIAYFEQKRQEKFGQGLAITDSAVLAVSSKIFDLNQRYEALKKHFERDYPDYYHLKYDYSTASVRQVQEVLLQPGQTLLEYFVGDSSIFIFAIRQQDFQMAEVKKDFPLETWVSDLRKNLLENRSTGATQYCELAYRLYQKLLEPAKPLLTDDLIIIPDGVLGYLPFEVLLTQKPDKPARFGRHDYVLNHHRVSYCYSATLLREMMHKERKNTRPKNALAAFAPFYSGDTTLLAGLFGSAAFRKDLQLLQFSGAEVFGIQKMLGGEVFYGEAATEDCFLREAGKASILHLATHGKADDLEGDYSFLAFSERKDSLENEILYVRDLYNMTLNADLVTLSACETGIGKLQRGEGIISLARAFTYAGAQSIVTSLWSVNDEQTKDLMLLFYKGLRKGLPKNEALRQAKISLSKRPGAHPFFWAGFIAIGDMRPLDW